MRMRRNAAFCLALWAALTAGFTSIAAFAAHADEPVKARARRTTRGRRPKFRKAKPPTPC